MERFDRLKKILEYRFACFGFQETSDYIEAWCPQEKKELLDFRGGKMYLCHGVPVYGKAMVLKEEKGRYIRIRLKS